MRLSAFITFLKMRPQVRTEFLTLFISLVFTLLCNGVFWNALLAGRDSLTSGTWLMLLCTGLLITGLLKPGLLPVLAAGMAGSAAGSAGAAEPLLAPMPAVVVGRWPP